MNNKERSIWVNLGLALLSIPIASLIILVSITVIGAMDDYITKIQNAGYWWVMMFPIFIITLIYFVYEPKIRINIEREKVVNALILYLKEQFEKQGKAQPSDQEVKLIHEMLLERFKIWAWFDSSLWRKYFPEEKYSKYLFGIVDNFIIFWQHQKNKYFN